MYKSMVWHCIFLKISRFLQSCTSEELKTSGRRKFSRAHSSWRLFCSGVPVNNNLFVDLNSLTISESWRKNQIIINAYTTNYNWTVQRMQWKLNFGLYSLFNKMYTVRRKKKPNMFILHSSWNKKRKIIYIKQPRK